MFLNILGILASDVLKNVLNIITRIGVHAFFICISKKIRASIFDIRVGRVKLKEKMSPANCSRKITMYLTLVATNIVLSTIWRFYYLCCNYKIKFSAIPQPRVYSWHVLKF